MRPDRQEGDRWRQMQEVVLAVNGIAGDLNIPILLLSQLNREAAADKTHPPSLAHLRDTGTAEENCANVLFLWQEPPKKPKEGKQGEQPSPPPTEPTQPEEVKLVIAKQRNGWAGGHISLLFYKQWTRFESK
jgi:replicative DNA helicase